MTDRFEPTPERLRKTGADPSDVFVYGRKTGSNQHSKYGKVVMVNHDLFHKLERQGHFRPELRHAETVSVLRRLYGLSQLQPRVTMHYSHVRGGGSDDMPTKVAFAKKEWNRLCTERPRDMPLIWRVLDLTHGTAEEVGAAYSVYKTKVQRQSAGVMRMLSAIEAVGDLLGICDK